MGSPRFLSCPGSQPRRSRETSLEFFPSANYLRLNITDLPASHVTRVTDYCDSAQPQTASTFREKGCFGRVLLLSLSHGDGVDVIGVRPRVRRNWIGHSNRFAHHKPLSVRSPCLAPSLLVLQRRNQKRRLCAGVRGV